jgi:hypothetical protein
MNRLIEMLETRQFLSASILHAAVQAPAHQPVIHVAETQNVTLKYQGTAYNTTSAKVAANIQLTLTKTSKGYSALVIAVDPSKPAGVQQRFTMDVNASGHFVYDTKSKDRTFHLEGQVSADQSAINGTFKESTAGSTNVGTVTLDRVTMPTPTPTHSPTPTPSPAPTPKPTVTGPTYKGSATSASGKVSALTLVVFKTTDGSTFGFVTHVNGDATTDQIYVKFDVKGHFVFDGEGKNAGLHVEGQMSADKSTISGAYASKNGSSTEMGTFALART